MWVRRLFLRFPSYVVASALALAIDYSMYWFLASHAGVKLEVAAVAGYLTGLVAAYFMISRKVFADGWLREKRHAEALLFALSGLLGVSLTYITIYLYVQIVGEQMHGAKLVAVAVSFFSVFVFRKFAVFGARAGQ